MPDPTGPAHNQGFSFPLAVLAIVAIAAIVAITYWG
jgi:hypothetical protein